ncbi:MAG: hypothetical protein OEY49_19900 [Candidatus Heimdallarchaeota archaeon]|nr:hypothetical protein [Candidatus Heimdallarchaeota archaeon]
MKTLLIPHYKCGSLATAGMVWAERVYVYTKKIMYKSILVEVLGLSNQLIPIILN